MTTTSEDAQVVPLLPLHAVADGGVQRPRGRPQKVERAPSRADLEHHAKVAQEQAEHVEHDPVVRAVLDGQTPRDVLTEVAEALAKEAAVLAFQRQQLELRGRDVGQLVSRRSKILMELTKVQIQLREIAPEVLDVRSPQVVELIRFFIETIRDVARDVLPEQHFDVLFNRLENRFEGWEEEVEARLR